MPAKSRKQQRYIFYLRNKYGSPEKTPKKYKWIWHKDWEKLEEAKRKKKKKKRRKNKRSYLKPDSYYKKPYGYYGIWYYHYDDGVDDGGDAGDGGSGAGVGEAKGAKPAKKSKKEVLRDLEVKLHDFNKELKKLLENLGF
ncbi:hypothetical protein Rm378p132 [Rhodothermus phage RM378]|uniref:hypothetical protein n=1 Tax=Rhodothermus phage RM378 TaxID=148943 RepID=UPI000018F684|nr:hypothetical protein Rm378p132 [Rhodothermus phage RM378]